MFEDLSCFTCIRFSNYLRLRQKVRDTVHRAIRLLLEECAIICSPRGTRFSGGCTQPRWYERGHFSQQIRLPPLRHLLQTSCTMTMRSVGSEQKLLSDGYNRVLATPRFGPHPSRPTRRWLPRFPLRTAPRCPHSLPLPHSCRRRPLLRRFLRQQLHLPRSPPRHSLPLHLREPRT